MKRTAALFALLSALPLPLAAEEAVISDMERPNWSFYGNVKAKQIDASEAPGGKMIQIDVTRKGANYWDSAATSEPVKAVKQGQIVTLGFYARAGSDGPAAFHANVGELAAPYGTAVISKVELDSNVTFYCIEGVSKISFGNKEGKVTLHVAEEKQKIDLGPYIVTVRNPEDGPTQLPCQKIIQSW